MDWMPDFINGLKLSEMFFFEAVQPILSAHFPGLSCSAARLDYGSEVLGFDTPQSRDHHWGSRVMLYLSEAEKQTHSDRITRVLAEKLPSEFYGYPTNFVDLDTSDAVMQPLSGGTVNHYVQVTSVEEFFCEYIGLDVTQPMNARDWLLIPQQRLRTIASGKIFYDDLNRLESIVDGLSWYPHDLWLYLMANQWRRIDQEEPFVGRCGDVGDELGSRIIGTRLVHELMQLCFLMEKQFAPYSKWFGTAFSKLKCSQVLSPIFQDILDSQNWKEREKHLSRAYLVLGQMHNALDVTAYLKPEITSFHSRPYLVPHSGRYVDALLAQIHSDEIKALPQHAGSVDQFVNSIDVLESMHHCRRLAVIYVE
ncbi:MAG: DUF4037 domain-containing protein [Anaerolineaceae bacterium]|nr:DUF4037 domain-containing protein [Anaerolineaceae bacterium]